MPASELFTAITILGGALVLILASGSIQGLIQLLKGSRYRGPWQVAQLLVGLFVAGYFGSLSIVILHNHTILHTVVGVVYFFGALFVLLVARLSHGAISDLMASSVSRAEMENIITAIPDVLLVVGPEGRIQRVNQAAIHATGWDERALANVPVALVFPELEGFRPDCKTREYSFESWMCTCEGLNLPVSMSISVLVDKNCRIISYVCLAKDISTLKEDQARLEHEASHDALTGLPNRAALVERLEIELRRGCGAGPGLLFIDLDHFKPINDQYGHLFGDHLLTAVARRLETCVRSGDMVARYGGDEFVVLLCGATELEDVEQAAGRVLAGLSAPFKVDGQALAISASIGCLACGGKPGEAARALRDADMALYQAKAAGRARAVFYAATPSPVVVC